MNSPRISEPSSSYSGGSLSGAGPSVEVRRDLVLSLLKGAVATCRAQRGGVIALIGETGCGKSLVANAFVRESGGDATLLLGPLDAERGTAALPPLHGVCFIDDPDRFANLSQSIRRAVREASAVVVLICMDHDEANRLAGVHVDCTVSVSRWTVAAAIQRDAMSTTANQPR